MDEVNDQVQQDNPTSSKEEPQGQALPEQSETTKDVAEEVKPQLFKDHMGRELTAEQLHTEYLKTQGYVTKLEQKQAEWEKSAQKEASLAISENEYLKNVDPNVREAIVQIVTPVIEDRFRRRDEDAKKRAQQDAFDNEINSVLKIHDGKDGLPKADREALLAEIMRPGNNNFNVSEIYDRMYRKQIIDKAVRDAIKGKSAEVETENTGGQTTRKPETKTPKTWDEAARSAMTRM